MTKIQVDSNGKAIMLGGKALVASEDGVTPTGTLSITQNGTYNVTNYASANVSVSSGGGGTGITREVSAQGVYQMPATSFTFSLPSNATDLGQYAMYSAFYGCTGLTSVDLSSLTTVSGRYAMRQAFYNCTGLTSVDLSSLTTVSGGGAMLNAFTGCTGITSVDLSSLTTVRGDGAMSSAFANCTSLTTLSFPSLTSTGFGSYTNQFDSMLYGVTGCTAHFPSNLQSVIGSWSSVTRGFSGTNTTVLFDLPATT